MFGYAAGGGASEYTRFVLSSDFTTSDAAQQAVTGLEFTPEAGSDYEVLGTFLVSSTVATNGARHGVIWPTGGTLVHATGVMRGFNSLTSETYRASDSATLSVCHTTNVNGVDEIQIAQMWLRVKYSVAPSTALQVSLNSEAAATNVTMHAGSELSVRVVA